MGTSSNHEKMMCNSAKKAKPTESLTTLNQQQWATCSSSKSPKAKVNDVNAILAKINLQESQFDNILTALGSPRAGHNTRDNGLHNPCNLTPLPDKNNHITPPSLPHRHQSANKH
jgi:hypothetical protein